MQAMTFQASGPAGDFVVRADRRGVPMETTMWGWNISDLKNRIGRLRRRDQAWVVRVRPRETDPSGPDVYSEVVATKDDLPKAFDRVIRSIRQGDLPVAG